MSIGRVAVVVDGKEMKSVVRTHCRNPNRATKLLLWFKNAALTGRPTPTRTTEPTLVTNPREIFPAGSLKKHLLYRYLLAATSALRRNPH